MPAWIAGLLAKGGQVLIGFLVDKVWGLVMAIIKRWQKSQEIAKKKAEFDKALKDPTKSLEDRRKAFESYINSAQS